MEFEVFTYLILDGIKIKVNKAIHISAKEDIILARMKKTKFVSQIKIRYKDMLDVNMKITKINLIKTYF